MSQRESVATFVFFMASRRLWNDSWNGLWNDGMSISRRENGIFGKSFQNPESGTVWNDSGPFFGTIFGTMSQLLSGNTKRAADVAARCC